MVSRRIDGEWQALGTGANGEVRDFAVHPNGDIYMVGAFTAVGGVASTRGIARWNGSVWESVGGGLDDGVAYQAVISTMDTAIAEGLPDIGYLDPPLLSVRFGRP